MARLYILQLIAGIVGGFIAAKKGRSVLFWFLLCFILPLFTIVILILPSLKAEAAGRRCPNCSQPLSKREDRCGHCGWQTPIELVQCSTCGSFVSGQENCPTCSRKR
ncbi:MAG: hypothetical protein HZB62_08135 [Nitrospirae bacterium]|nr:hypothetical protein [Nitrospirota bacterium]